MFKLCAQKLVIKWPGSVHDSRNFFLNSSVNKVLWKETIPQSESPSNSIQVFLFGDSAYPLFPFIMTEFWGGGNNQDQSSSVINGLLHVSQLRIHLVHWKPVLDAHNILWILIYPCSSFISSLSITQLFWVTKGKKSRTEPCVSPEKRVQPAASNLSFKGFLNEKKATDIPSCLNIVLWINLYLWHVSRFFAIVVVSKDL